MSRLALLLALLVVPACGGDDGGDADPFDNLQDCFDDHHVTEGFTVEKAITICCLDHPIANNDPGVVCGPTVDTCETYVNANIAGTDASGDEITAACTDYVNQAGS